MCASFRGLDHGRVAGLVRKYRCPKNRRSVMSNNQVLNRLISHMNRSTKVGDAMKKELETDNATHSRTSSSAQKTSPNSGAEHDILERVFLADHLIPDAATAFEHNVPEISQIIQEADIVLDTNVLLLPYGAGTESLKEIVKIFQELANEKKIFLPGQVVREFIRNRPTKLGDLQQQLNDKISRYQPIEKLNFPILEGNEGYSNLNSIIQKSTELKKELQAASRTVVQQIKSWQWNDPVTNAYKTIFNKSNIISPEIVQNEVLTELKKRHRLSIPPGYKDAQKEDLGIGDFLIWKTILLLGSKNKKPLIFVSGDEKPDWQHQSGGLAFLPRYELLEEYRNFSTGKPFYIVPLSKLLELLKARQESVIQIKNEEERVKSEEESIHQNSITAQWAKEIYEITIACPCCEDNISTVIGGSFNSKTRTRCRNCSAEISIHLKNGDIEVIANGKIFPNTEIIQSKEITCPRCEKPTLARISSHKKKFNFSSCSNCGAIFPTSASKTMSTTKSILDIINMQA
jgi:transcription elongation factor Elf1/rRNA-processing protein FCF1